MSFNSTLDIGDLLKFAGLLLAGFWFLSRLAGRLDLVAAEIKTLKDIVSLQAEQLSEFTKALIQLARQDERLNSMHRTVEDLRRGRGWIQADLDGEYVSKRTS